MLLGYATVFMPSYARATPGQRPFVGISLRNQGMDQASPKAWRRQPKQFRFIGTEPLSAPKAMTSSSLACQWLPAWLHTSLVCPGSPPTLQKIWGNGRHGDILKNSIAHSSFETGFKGTGGDLFKGQFVSTRKLILPFSSPVEAEEYFSHTGSQLVWR